MSSVSRLPSVRRPAAGSNRNRPVSLIEEASSNLQNISTVPSDAEASKKAKRRSLLPQFNRKVSSEERGEFDIKEEDEDSGSRTTSDDARVSEDSFGRRTIDEDRKVMPPPTSKLSRPASIIPPRGASQFARTKSKALHAREDSREVEANDDMDADAARAQSLAALTGGPPTSPSKLATPASNLQRVGSTRLPQSPRVGGPAIPSRTTSSKASHAKDSSIRSNPGNVTTTISEKPPSQADQLTANTSPPRSSATNKVRSASQSQTQQTSPPRASATGRTRPVSQLMPPPARPAFNTFQQHYSPAKSALPKPGLPTAKSSKPSAVPEEGVDMTFDLAKQQIELLQLSLLHQASAECLQEYTASAKRKLGKKHTRLRKDYESIRATELVQQRTSNLVALESWCRDPGMLVENLQILSLVYSDLTALIEEGSRHGDVVSMFELWVNEAETLEPGTFVQPLPDDWKAAQSSLALKLRSIQRNLRVLPPPSDHGDQTSGLAVVLKGCEALVDGMMKELEVMVKVEKELLAHERNRLEDDVKALVLEDVGMQSLWVPVWQKA